LRGLDSIASAIPDDKKSAASADLVAFTLSPDSLNSGPWHTYFGPVGSRIYEDGAVIFFPDVRKISGEVLDHWIDRSRALSHPVMKARYADLAWEMCKEIDGRKRDPENAKTAAQAYVDSFQQGLDADFHTSLKNICRALDLARSINDTNLVLYIRNLLLALHNRAVTSEGHWAISFDRLIEERKPDLTDEDRGTLISSLETLFAKFSELTNGESFNPYELEQLANVCFATIAASGHGTTSSE
jgi:hypothetical protein